ncbi:hypothetical protein Tco_1017823 [Tanacetum coccineum]|uniref:Uncharacterized protein n=1 Tax=Tanacetum coccineum TaxID=301880 RepID=A0ABQ5FSK1_9ASTR
MRLDSERCYGGFGYGVRNDEGRTILEFVAAHDLVVVNSFFKKRRGMPISILFIVGTTTRRSTTCWCAKGTLGYVKIARSFRVRFELFNTDSTEAFKARVIEGVTPEEEDGSVADAEQMWNRLANTIREAAKETLGVVAGTLRTRIGHRESWWISDEVQDKVKAKQKEKRRRRIAKARDKSKRDLGNVRFIKDGDGRTIVNEDAIRRRWKEYSRSLFYGLKGAGERRSG